ncbi:MAG: PIG-L family deacetylase [Gaiellaceae bacterium]
MKTGAGVLAWLGLRRPGEALPGRVVVVSPHLDDGVLSLGGAIASATRRGARVTILTVLAGDPESSQPAGEWDSRAGFTTEGEAVRARREEDRRACARVGAETEWLQFPDEQYGLLDDDRVSASVRERVGNAAVLLPGFPLAHPDHARLNALLLGRGLGGARVGLYAEQPYALWADRSPPAGWHAPPAGLRDRLAKRRACREYVTQLPLLGERVLAGIARYEARHGGEAVSWLT